MHARSALFDLYGDHLRGRDGQARVAALVRLLAPVGIAAPAVRTAISRMMTQGWLEPVTIDGARGYRTTAQATRRLDEAAGRIYPGTKQAWDGTWHLALVIPPAFERRELASVLARDAATSHTARAVEVDPLPTSAWDLDALRTAYDAWQRSAPDLLRHHLGAHADPDEAAFAARFHLVHEWRKFLFADPGLPDELLPADWPGRRAAEVFAAEAERLRPETDRFVQRCLEC